MNNDNSLALPQDKALFGLGASNDFRLTNADIISMAVSAFEEKHEAIIKCAKEKTKENEKESEQLSKSYSEALIEAVESHSKGLKKHAKAFQAIGFKTVTVNNQPQIVDKTVAYNFVVNPDNKEKSNLPYGSSFQLTLPQQFPITAKLIGLKSKLEDTAKLRVDLQETIANAKLELSKLPTMARAAQAKATRMMLGTTEAGAKFVKDFMDSFGK